MRFVNPASDFEIKINRRWRISDFFSDFTHRDIFAAFFGKHLSRHVENLLPQISFFPFSPLLNAHKKINTVKLI